MYVLTLLFLFGPASPQGIDEMTMWMEFTDEAACFEAAQNVINTPPPPESQTIVKILEPICEKKVDTD